MLQSVGNRRVVYLKTCTGSPTSAERRGSSSRSSCPGEGPSVSIFACISFKARSKRGFTSGRWRSSWKTKKSVALFTFLWQSKAGVSKLFFFTNPTTGLAELDCWIKCPPFYTNLHSCPSPPVSRPCRSSAAWAWSSACARSPPSGATGLGTRRAGGGRRPPRRRGKKRRRRRWQRRRGSDPKGICAIVWSTVQCRYTSKKNKNFFVKQKTKQKSISLTNTGILLKAEQYNTFSLIYHLQQFLVRDLSSLPGLPQSQDDPPLLCKLPPKSIFGKRATLTSFPQMSRTYLRSCGLAKEDSATGISGSQDNSATIFTFICIVVRLWKKSFFSVQWFSADASIKFKVSSTNSCPACVPGSQMRSALHYLPLQMHGGGRGLKGPSLSQFFFPEIMLAQKWLCLNLISLILALASSN